jgi:protein PhnA
MQTNCPKCESENIYQDGSLWICPECSHEWSDSDQKSAVEEISEMNSAFRDSNGNELKDGDSVVVLKDLKIKGSSSVVKGGTKVRNIRLQHGNDGHDISCKIDGIGSVNLKSEFVRKA